MGQGIWDLDSGLTKIKLKAYVLDQRVSQLKRLLRTGLPIFSVFVGILPKRPDVVNAVE